MGLKRVDEGTGMTRPECNEMTANFNYKRAGFLLGFQLDFPKLLSIDSSSSVFGHSALKFIFAYNEYKSQFILNFPRFLILCTNF